MCIGVNSWKKECGKRERDVRMLKKPLFGTSRLKHLSCKCCSSGWPVGSGRNAFSDGGWTPLEDIPAKWNEQWRSTATAVRHPSADQTPPEDRENGGANIKGPRDKRVWLQLKDGMGYDIAYGDRSR